MSKTEFNVGDEIEAYANCEDAADGTHRWRTATVRQKEHTPQGPVYLVETDDGLVGAFSGEHIRRAQSAGRAAEEASDPALAT